MCELILELNPNKKKKIDSTERRKFAMLHVCKTETHARVWRPLNNYLKPLLCCIFFMLNHCSHSKKTFYYILCVCEGYCNVFEFRRVDYFTLIPHEYL